MKSVIKIFQGRKKRDKQILKAVILNYNMGKLGWILFIVVLALAIMAAFSFRDNIYPNEKENSIDDENRLLDIPEEEKADKKNLILEEEIQSDELHYAKSNLTFSFNNLSLCGDVEPNRVRRAFREMENQTEGAIKFNEIEAKNNESDVEVFCYKKVPLGDKPGYIISAEGLYWALGKKITRGELKLYNVMGGNYVPGCGDFPDVEIHEILHAFGIGHIDDKKSIMYPEYQGCTRVIDKELIEYLKGIYG